MSIPKEYRDICQMLKEATDQGRVNWIEKKGGVFAVYLPQYSFELWSGSDDAGRSFVATGIRDPVTSYFLDSFHIEEGEEDYSKLLELFHLVRRQVRQVNQRLDALREMLKQGRKVGALPEEILIIHSAQYGGNEVTIDVAELLRSRIIDGSIKNFQVNNENFGKDPIPGVRKILKVDYLYHGETHSISIQEGSTLTIPEKAD